MTTIIDSLDRTWDVAASGQKDIYSRPGIERGFPAGTDQGAVIASLDALVDGDEAPPTVEAIKAKARAIICERYPEWKQTNMVARMTELLLAAQQDVLTADETAEVEALRSAWSWVKAVRLHSNALELALANSDPVTLLTGWPA